MSSEQTWTIGRLLQWTADYFKKHGSSTPRLDAEVLLAETMHCERIQLYTAYDQLAKEDDRARFRELVRRRAAGEPVAYLVGHREFYSERFTVNGDVLIPRPETELLVVTLLEVVKNRPANGHVDIADVGTGSGVIALCAAKHIASARVTALDISPAALSVARQNSEVLGVADRVQFVESDLLDRLPEAAQFDVVASNPPYVSRAEMDALPDDVKQYEPELALLGGPTGTEVIQRLVAQAAIRLRRKGTLLVEISPMIEERVVEIFHQETKLEPPTVTKDLAGLSRLVSAQRGGE